MEQIRLQKFLALAGVASRRKAESFIEEGLVRVNGKVVKEMGCKVDPSTDKVFYNGKQIILNDKKVYYLLYKPDGYVTTVQDQFERPTVMDFFKDCKERVYPVGRLDYGTSGLLLMTNDGDFAYKVTHPKHELSKTYRVVVKGQVTEDAIKQLCRGVRIENHTTLPAKAKILEFRKTRTVVELTIFEGKNRQVRKMFWALGHSVQKLKRIGIGDLTTEGLKEGQYRELTKTEVNDLVNLKASDAPRKPAGKRGGKGLRAPKSFKAKKEDRNNKGSDRYKKKSDNRKSGYSKKIDDDNKGDQKSNDRSRSYNKKINGDKRSYKKSYKKR